jgi:hypothetical protein
MTRVPTRPVRSAPARVGPTTVFFDGSGQRTFVRQGGYTTEALLEQDLRTYALGAAR